MYADMQGELKLTVLISWESGEAVIESHVAALPGRPQPPVKVQVTIVQCVRQLCVTCTVTMITGAGSRVRGPGF